MLIARDPEMIAFATACVRIVLLTFFVMSSSQIFAAVLNGAGEPPRPRSTIARRVPTRDIPFDSKTSTGREMTSGDMRSPMVVSVSTAVFVGAPLAWWLVTHSDLGATGMWIANVVYALLAAGILIAWQIARTHSLPPPDANHGQLFSTRDVSEADLQEYRGFLRSRARRFSQTVETPPS